MRLITHKSKVRKKKMQVKDNIKQATIELLAEKGYASVSTRDIAKRADTAVGQLTYYYKTKDALILEVIDEIIEGFISELEEISNTSNNRVESMREYLNKMIEKENKTSRIIIDLISQSLYSNILSIKSKNMIDRIINIFAKILIEENENIVNPINEAENYVNYFLGAIIRKNISNNALEKENYAFNLVKGNKIKQKSLSAKVAYN